jgi:hypothetical protein
MPDNIYIPAANIDARYEWARRTDAGRGDPTASGWRPRLHKERKSQPAPMLLALVALLPAMVVICLLVSVT